MNEKKVLQNLKEMGYIDEKELFCYSYANITTSTNYVLFMKLSSINQAGLPSFMILSVCNDKLHILKAGMFGKPKDYFTSINIKKMKYVGSFSKDFINSYEFSIDFGENQYEKFYIQGSYKKHRMFKVVNEICSFNEENRK